MKSSEQIRLDFPMLNDLIYLDSASTSLTPKQVIESMNEYYYKYNSNTGRGAYKIAIKASQKVDQTREKIAKFINSEKNEIIFTQNTTEAINIVANGLNFKKEDNIIISNIEHHSNFIPWLNLKKYGVEIKIVEANNDGIVEPSAIEEKLDDKTRLVSINHISNSIGSLQDIEKIGKLTHENNSLFLVDGAQSIGHVHVDSKKINADFIASPGHKGLLGPTGTGFLYLNKKIADDLKPMALGGGTVVDVDNQNFTLEQVPYRFEGGTQNIGGIIGLGSAIDYINSIKISNIENYCSELTKYLWKRLSEINGVILYGNPKNIHNIVSFNIKGANSHDVAKILDETGNICVRSGFHCAIPYVKNLDSENGTVRSSIHYYNNFSDIEKFSSVLEEIAIFFNDA